MNERDKRLLPQLIQNLDSMDNDNEIAMTVRQLRRIQAGEPGADGKPSKVSDLLVNSVQTESMPMADDRHGVFTKLRDLGRLLEMMSHPQPEARQSLLNVAYALQHTTPVTFQDLRMVLSVFRDVVRGGLQAAARERQQPPEGHYHYPGPDPAWGSRQGRGPDMADLAAMAAQVNNAWFQERQRRGPTTTSADSFEELTREATKAMEAQLRDSMKRR